MKILRLKNDTCEMVEIGDDVESLQAEIGGCYLCRVHLSRTLRMITNNDSKYVEDRTVNEPASGLYMNWGGTSVITGSAFLCSFDTDTKQLISLTETDYETAKKILTKYGYVKGS